MKGEKAHLREHPWLSWFLQVWKAHVAEAGNAGAWDPSVDIIPAVQETSFGSCSEMLTPF